MIEIIRTCDKCNEVVPAKEQLWNIGIVKACHPSTLHNRYADDLLRAQWCRPCMVKAGLLGTNDEIKALEQPPTAPTLEDIIREIVREEMEGAHE